MFSPSLISMMLHSLRPDLRFSLAPPSLPHPIYKTMREVAASLQNVAYLPGIEWPEIPVVGWTRREKDELYDWFRSSVVIPPREAGDLYFWGRIPLDILLQFF
jgi:hypothetical protein